MHVECHVKSEGLRPTVSAQGHKKPGDPRWTCSDSGRVKPQKWSSPVLGKWTCCSNPGGIQVSNFMNYPPACNPVAVVKYYVALGRAIPGSLWFKWLSFLFEKGEELSNTYQVSGTVPLALPRWLSLTLTRTVYSWLNYFRLSDMKTEVQKW